MLVADFVDSVDTGFDAFWEWLPNVLGAIAVLVVVWLVAKLVAGIVHRLLVRVGVDRLVSERGPEYLKRVAPSLSRAAGSLVFWLILLAGFGMAANVLGVSEVQDAIDSIWSYIPNVLAAIAILVVAGLIAPWASRLVSAAMPERPLGSLLGTAVSALILAVAVFMALDQLDIAGDIVMITYAALVGSVALGMALAFGLGGRDAAASAIKAAQDRGAELARPAAEPAPPSAGPTGSGPD